MRSPLLHTALGAIGLLLAATAGTASAAPGWSVGPSMHDERAGHTVTTLPNGELLAAGGWTGAEAPTFTAELYDPVTERWTRTARMASDRMGHTATLLRNGRVLVAGGGTGLQAIPTTSAELYDPATGQWSPAKPMSAARRDHTATSLADGRVLVAGGSATAGAEIYDPSADAWTSTKPMLSVRRRHSATLVNGRILVVGGHDGAAYVAGAESYDPVADHWGAEQSLTSPRGGHVGALLGNMVVVAGGYGPELLSSVQIAPTSGIFWAPAATMALARGNPTGVVVSDGSLLVSGGNGSGAKLASAELYDPQRNAWNGAGAMSSVRVGHKMTLLGDGRVLVTGGYGPQIFSVKTSDFWTPTTTAAIDGALGFGAQELRVTGEPRTLTVSNQGRSPLLISDVRLGGAQGVDFVVTGDQCSGSAVVPGGSCQIAVGFTPQGVGPRSGSLFLDVNTTPSSRTVALSGEGVLTPEPPLPPEPSPTPVPVATAAPTPAPTATVTPTPPSATVRIPFRSSFSPPGGYRRSRVCRGKVALTLKAGERTVASRTVALDRRCRYRVTFTVGRERLRGHTRLTVVARFKGNRYLGSTSATYRVRVSGR